MPNQTKKPWLAQRKLIQQCLLILLGTTLWTGVVDAAGMGTSFISTKQFTGVLSDGTTLQVKIQCSSFLPSFTYNLNWSWGVWGAPPKTVLTTLDVRIGAERLDVPISAIVGLTNVRRASLRVRGRAYAITVVGGDAGALYRAELDFDGTHIRKRRVANGEFPDDRWEETTYKFNTKTGY